MSADNAEIQIQNYQNMINMHIDLRKLMWAIYFFKFHPKALMIETKVKGGLPHLG